MGTDQDARKRRAVRGQEGSQDDAGSEDDDPLAVLWNNADEYESGDDELSEEAKQQLQHAVLKQSNVSIKSVVGNFQQQKAA